MSSEIDDDPPTQRPSASVSDDEFWLVSYTENDDRELTTKEIVAAMKRGEITLSTLVWREGMGEWQAISAIDELRARAGFIVQPFFTDAPPRSEPDSLKAIAALAGDIEELSSSDVHSSPPSSLAEADFLGIDEPDASLAPPRIDHAAFFKSDPPPDGKKKDAALPALPSLGGRSAASSSTTSASGATASQNSEGGGLKWILVLLTVAGAAAAGFLLTPANDEPPPPPQPVAKAAAREPAVAEQPAAATPSVETAAANTPPAPNPTAAAATPTEPAAAPSPAAAPVVKTTTTAAAPAVPQPATPAAAPAAATPTPAAAPSPPPAPRSTSTAPFDKSAAGAALTQAAANASACRQPGDPSGTAQVEVTFSPSGRATRAIIGGPPFRGTATGSCIAQAMRTATVPPFGGDLVTVQKRVIIQ